MALPKGWTPRQTAAGYDACRAADRRHRRSLRSRRALVRLDRPSRPTAKKPDKNAEPSGRRQSCWKTSCCAGLQRPRRDHQHLRQGGRPRNRRRPVQRPENVQGRAAANDAWDIDSMYETNPVTLRARRRSTWFAAGPLVATLRMRGQLDQLGMTQEARLRRDSRRSTSSPRRLAGMPQAAEGGVPRRLPRQRGDPRDPVRPHPPAEPPRRGSSTPTASRSPTRMDRPGRGEPRRCAVLNDCKYGVNVRGTHQPDAPPVALAPDMTADRAQEFTYAFYAWNGTLADRAGSARDTT